MYDSLWFFQTSLVLFYPPNSSVLSLLPQLKPSSFTQSPLQITCYIHSAGVLQETFSEKASTELKAFQLEDRGEVYATFKNQSCIVMTKIIPSQQGGEVKPRQILFSFLDGEAYIGGDGGDYKSQKIRRKTTKCNLGHAQSLITFINLQQLQLLQLSLLKTGQS